MILRAGKPQAVKMETVLSRHLPFHQVHIRRQAPRTRLTAQQRLALWTVILLNGLCLALLGWNVCTHLSKTSNFAGNLLHAALSSSKLNVSSAEPVSLEMPAAMKTQEPVERTSEAPPTVLVPQAPQFAEPPRLAQVDAIPLALDWEPILVYSSNHAPQQGDSPMLRTWKSLEWAALLAVAVTAQPVLFAGEKEKEKPDIKSVLERLDNMDRAIAKAFKEVSETLDLLKGNDIKMRIDLDKVVAKVETLEDKLTKLHADLDKLKKRVPVEQPSLAGVDDLKFRLEKIEQALGKMQGANRIALSPPNTGRIQLINMYPEELLFVVNGKTYRVEPNRSMFLENHPAGAFTYEVIAPRVYGLITRKTSSLDPNETFTITAR
jgi:hypothetical protein